MNLQAALSPGRLLPGGESERPADPLREVAGRRLAGRLVANFTHLMAVLLGGGLDRSAMRGLALFSCAGRGFLREIRVGRSLRDQVTVDRSPRVAQLEEALEADIPFVVVLADRQRCRIFLVRLGEAHDVVGPYDERARAVDVDRELGGFGHYEAEARRHHLRRCAQALHQIEQLPGAHVVLGGTETITADLERDLDPAVRRRLAGRIPLSMTVKPVEVAAAVADLGRDLEQRAEEELVEQLRQFTAAGRGGVVGLEPTLEALAERRVATLLVSREFSAWGGRCGSCGWVGPGQRLCPRCGTRLEEVDDVVEVALDEALAQKAGVVVCDHTDLDRFGRIGAIERF
jgi:peptide chain release factor subunit 1